MERGNYNQWIHLLWVRRSLVSWQACLNLIGYIHVNTVSLSLSLGSRQITANSMSTTFRSLSVGLGLILIIYLGVFLIWFLVLSHMFGHFLGFFIVEGGGIILIYSDLIQIDCHLWGTAI